MAHHDWRQRGFKNTFTKKKSTSEVTGIFKVTASTAKEMMQEYLLARLFAEGNRDLINRELKKSRARGDSFDAMARAGRRGSKKGRGGVLGGQSAAEMYDEALLHQFEQRVARRAMDEGCALRPATCHSPIEHEILKMRGRERVGGGGDPRSTEPSERRDWAETGWRTSFPSIPRTHRGWRTIPIRRRKVGNLVPRPPRRRRQPRLPSTSRTGCGGGEDGYGGDAEGGGTDDDGEDGDDDGDGKDEEDKYDDSNGDGETGKGKRTVPVGCKGRSSTEEGRRWEYGGGSSGGGKVASAIRGEASVNATAILQWE